MPVGARKNQLYALALPLMGLRPRWRGVTCDDAAREAERADVERVFCCNRVVGGCVRVFRGYALAETYSAGWACLSPREAATAGTIFRTASVAKFATALLVARLQALGRVDADEDIGALWGAPIRNPHCPEAPITLAALLSHTSGLTDSPAYFASLGSGGTLGAILADGACFAAREPGERFQYSNLAAGMIGSLLEKRFDCSLETLAREVLFAPLGVEATFDLHSLADTPPASSYRVLPPSRAPSFDARARAIAAPSAQAPDPERHFSLASGSLFLTADALAKLALLVASDGQWAGKPFLDAAFVRRMKTPVSGWPDATVRMRHGLGMLCLDDPAVCRETLYGHQGFAYGAVNGVFLDGRGNGFASLNSGASELRDGHLSRLNRELIGVFFGGAA